MTDMKPFTLEEIAQYMRDHDWDDESEIVQTLGIMQRWLDRGDGIAVYENQDLGHPDLGHRKYVSYGSPAALLETDEPPQTLPDIGGTINWRYQLIGVYRPKEHEITFGTLHPDGSLTDVKKVKQTNVLSCPHLIFDPDHYREDGSCRCDDPTDSKMADWGYTWDGSRWVA